MNEQLPKALNAKESRLILRLSNPRQSGRPSGVGDYDLHHLGAQLRSQLRSQSKTGGESLFPVPDIDHPIFQVINQQSRDYGPRGAL